MQEGDSRESVSEKIKREKLFYFMFVYDNKKQIFLHGKKTQGMQKQPITLNRPMEAKTGKSAFLCE